MAFVVDGVIEEWDLSTLQAGVVGSFIQIGLLFGSVFWAWIGGKYGRMYAFKTCIIVVSAASILLTFSPNFYVVSTALTILGFGIAGELSLPSTVFYEFCPPSKRFYITLMTLFQGFGAILVSLIAYLVSLFNYTGIYNWRIIVAVGAVVGIISMIFRFFMHETPAFLITQNKQVAADDVLNIISLKNTGEVLGKNENSSSLNPNEFTQEVEETPKEIENISENVARLFKPPLLKVTIVLSLVYFI
jgi:MFS family permease